MLIDFQRYYGMLARKEAIPEEDLVALLRAASSLQNGLAYLASCQAATLEGLPKSASKSSVQRHVAITKTFAEVMVGDTSSIRYPERCEAAHERCLKALKDRTENS